ncbi:MAG: hypothetical protein C0P76_014695 [Acidimicrobiia bacterium]
MLDVRLNVSQLRELQRALRATTDGTPRVIQTAAKEAAEITVKAARANAAGTQLPSRIVAVGTTRAAAIRFYGHRPKGRSRTTDAFVQEFGGRAPLFGNMDRWYTVKPRKKDGYILYPAIRDTRQEVAEAFLDRLEDLLARHFNA